MTGTELYGTPTGLVAGEGGGPAGQLPRSKDLQGNISTKINTFGSFPSFFDSDSLISMILYNLFKITVKYCSLEKLWRNSLLFIILEILNRT
jgi:hypothetical protein